MFNGVTDTKEDYKEWNKRMNHFEAALGTEIPADRKDRVLKFIRNSFKKSPSNEIEEILVSFAKKMCFENAQILFKFIKGLFVRKLIADWMLHKDIVF